MKYGNWFFLIYWTCYYMIITTSQFLYQLIIICHVTNEWESNISLFIESMYGYS